MDEQLTEIYNASVEARNKYLELREVNNNSKMSIINALTWVTSTAIYSFRKILDVFMLDIASIFNSRINGTSGYYVNAMLKWQYGDSLVVNDEGTKFYYPNIDETKRLITYVSAHEEYDSRFQDNVLVLQVAKGKEDRLTKLNPEQLTSARAYLNQIKFAGVKCRVDSRLGDVLIPKVTVYYDGALSAFEMRRKISESLYGYMRTVKADSVIYVQKVIDAIQATEHVTDVYINPNADNGPQGIFVAQYDDSDILSEPQKIERKTYTSSGYLKESTKEGAEKELPKFSEAITLLIESH